MKIRPVLYIVGVVNMLIALSMALPLGVSLIYKDGDAFAFFISSVITLSAGAFLFFAFKSPSYDIGHREGFIVVALSWISASFFSSLPFLLSGALPSFVDALFEAVSGFTTTGASVFVDVEILPHGIVFWRSMTHLLGGLGIVVLGVAILPFLGIGGMQLYRAEASTLSGDKFAPRIMDVARILVVIYLLFNFTMTVLLIICGMGIFDALIHSFGALATGGFSNKNLSMGYFNAAAQWVTITFMTLGATNFSLHYGFYKKGLKAYTENEEFRFYMFTIAAATLIITIELYARGYATIAGSFNYAAFQTVSLSTTTGYATADFNLWPYLSQFILILLMLMGGSAGSTAGAIKCMRVLLLFKLFYKEIRQLIHPHAVTTVKINGKVVPPEILKSVTSFTFLYLAVFAVSIAVLAGTGLDIVTSLSSVAATLGGVGPGLGLTGPMANYSAIPTLSKWVLIFDMLVGRLELFTLIILFFPAFWKE